jgi:hypothetical protein
MVVGATKVPSEIVRLPPIVVAPVIVKVPAPDFVRPPIEPTVPAILTLLPFVSIVAFEARVKALVEADVMVPVA